MQLPTQSLSGKISSLFCDVKQRILVVSYRRFKAPYPSYWWYPQVVSKLVWLTTSLHCVTSQNSEDLTPRQKLEIAHYQGIFHRRDSGKHNNSFPFSTPTTAPPNSYSACVNTAANKRSTGQGDVRKRSHHFQETLEFSGEACWQRPQNAKQRKQPDHPAWRFIEKSLDHPKDRVIIVCLHVNKSN